jgi:hypothetical protein
MPSLQIMSPANKENKGKDEKYFKTTLKIETDLFWELKRLAVDQRSNVTPLVNEAIADLLGKYKKKVKSN